MFDAKSVSHLQKRLRQSTFSTDGDAVEGPYGHLVSRRFPNLEMFWQQCIVPATTRMDQPPGERADIRPGVSDAVWSMSLAHYSAFAHLVHARQRSSELSRADPFGSFYALYAHLGSACDVVEEFLFRLQRLVNRCTKTPINAIAQLTADQIQEKVVSWGGQAYPRAYEKYSTEGRSVSVPIHSRLDPLAEWFGGDKAWAEYKTLSGQIRAYRNVLIHAILMGTRVDLQQQHLVPKMNVIGHYRGLIRVLRASDEQVKRDFVDMRDQAEDTISSLEATLNEVWEWPLDTLTRLLYHDCNQALLAEYKIEFSQGTQEQTD